MTARDDTSMGVALAWCAGALGEVEVLSDHSKEHGGHASGTWRLATRDGACYLKVHADAAHWANEVHAYEHWAGVFGERAPRLLAVRDQVPLALVVTEVPGRVLENTGLPPATERAVWQTAGAALRALHALDVGPGFGPCRRDGAPAQPEGPAGAAPDAVAHVGRRFGRDIERAVDGGYIDATELATVRAAHDLIPAFAGEQPVPCHRDYCAANLLVDESGRWTGVIDFEFAYWDVRMIDFARDPDWAWIRRPDLFAAFVAGYGAPLTPVEKRQLHVMRAEYALGAILWGRDNAFYGFEREGHQALAHLSAVSR